MDYTLKIAVTLTVTCVSLTGEFVYERLSLRCGELW